MRALFDTHTLLWWNADDPQLSPVVRQIVADGRNEIFLSAASAWEIAIKAARGRLRLPESPEHYVASCIAQDHLKPLPIQLSHALHVFRLPPLHQDPFDRLLIAQSQLGNLPLLTSDRAISQYDVQTIW